MKIEYEIKGVTLNSFDMVQIREYFAAACTAEYVQDNFHDYNLSDEESLKIGYKVRELMDDYGYDEDDAIDTVISDLRLKGEL